MIDRISVGSDSTPVPLLSSRALPATSASDRETATRIRQSSRKQIERRDALGAHDRKMTSVERSYLRRSKPLGDCNDRCVDGSEREVVVTADQISHPSKIAFLELHEPKLISGERVKEGRLSLGTPLTLKQPAHLGQHRSRNQQQPGITLQQVQKSLVISVVGIESRDKRPCVDRHHVGRPSSARMIYSDRTARSPRPL